MNLASEQPFANMPVSLACNENRFLMRMPKEIDLDSSDAGSDVVRFRTRCGKVSGTAYRASGMYETHYDVIAARRLAKPHDEPVTLAPRMVPRPGTVGDFDVVGQVTFFFDDGVFIAEVHGFDFWVEPALIDQPVRLQDWVEVHIHKLTLYV